MRRLLSKKKSEKCRYKRCIGKRQFPVDKPKYCAKHVDKLSLESPDLHNFEFREVPIISDETHQSVFEVEMRHAYPTNLTPPKPSLLKRIRDFIFVSE